MTVDFSHSDDFTHFNNEGRAYMVNVGEKTVTHRTARAEARVLINRQTFLLIKEGGIKKGDVLTVAQIAGIMGAKRTSELIPMCHPVVLNGIDLSFPWTKKNVLSPLRQRFPVMAGPAWRWRRSLQCLPPP